MKALPCRYCGCNKIEWETNLFQTYSQCYCPVCNCYGPKMDDRNMPHRDKQINALAGWNKVMGVQIESKAS